MRYTLFILSLFLSLVWAEDSKLPPKPRSLEQVIKTIEAPASLRLKPALEKTGLNFSDFGGITLIHLKAEKNLEVWANTQLRNIFIKSYPLTATSGQLGPKYKEGDRQIPEGLYRLTHLNPNSLYHLSIGINYPNAYDRQLAKMDGRTNLGGDIMIHGKNVTIGCIPIGDKAIEEVFYMVYKVGIQRSDIIMSPVDFRNTDYQSKDIQENKLYEEIKIYMKEFMH